MRLPLTVGEIDLAWVGEALAQWTPGVRVAAIESKTVIEGTAHKILLRLAYADDAIPNGPPADLCVKGGFNEQLRPLVAYGNILEADFYAHVAKNLKAPMPRCWYACSEPDHGQGIVILDNLLVKGASFPDPLIPWSADQVAAALDTLAGIHGQTWGATPARYPWFRVGTWVREVAETLLSEKHWQQFFSLSSSPNIPPALQDRQRVHHALFEMWRLDDLAKERCLCHSDCHMGNTYSDADGRIGFLDWQAVAIAPHMDDVSNIIGGSLSIADRRTHERDLLQHYLAALIANGGPRLSFDEAWLNYRLYHMHGILWAVTPTSMQGADKVVAMTERHMAAIIDHDVLHLLES